MFKRLNTGGSILAPQEIRNCSSRMLGEPGIKFYTFLQERSSYPNFKTCIDPLSQSEKEQKGDEELVLRFFAAKNAQDLFRGSVRDWLDTYMEDILLGKIEFDYSTETQDFKRLFDYLSKILADGAFVRYRDQAPIGALAPAYFEAVTIGVFRVIENLETVDNSSVKAEIIEIVQSNSFKDNVGPGASTRTKLSNRIRCIQDGLTQFLG